MLEALSPDAQEDVRKTIEAQLASKDGNDDQARKEQEHQEDGS